jgi:hypothetical protein
MGTWTFFGHWDNDRIVVEYVVDGEVNDQRRDSGYWEEGLWCDSATADTEDEALAQLRDQYESVDDG